jgi:myo-inositol-1(or 4)-monophosphatase
MPDAVVACGFPHLGRPEHPRFLKEVAAVMGVTSGIRRMGAAALDLAWVACGRLDLYWERHIKSWDMSAGLILVREAGGFVSDADGGEDPLSAGSVACGNEVLHRELLSLLKQANR